MFEIWGYIDGYAIYGMYEKNKKTFTFNYKQMKKLHGLKIVPWSIIRINDFFYNISDFSYSEQGDNKFITLILE